jgi:HAD superfamily hydrolase (TIGR01509 family)
MIKYIVFDLDMTLIDTSCAEKFRTLRDWQSVYNTIPIMRMYPNIEKLIVYLEQIRIPYAIVSKSPSVYCKKVLDNFKLKPSFIIGYHDVTRRKPDPEALNLALSKFGHNSPKDVVHVGDKADDIIAAKAAGMISVAACWCCNNTEEFRTVEPDFIFSSPLQIIEIIERSRTI